MSKKAANSTQPGRLSPTPENIERAKAFVLQKWIARFHERYPRIAQQNPEEIPVDLSSACKFSSLFAQRVFGGRLRGNHNHQYLELNGEVIDLNNDAADVQRWLAEFDRTGFTGWKQHPEYEWNQTYHGHPHTHDETFFGSTDHRASMADCLPRVNTWVREFLAQTR